MKSMNIYSWTDGGFSLDPYDLIFLPGGHEKRVVQIINSPVVHKLIADYFPKTKKPSSKCCAAICHGVMVLSESSIPAGKSVLHEVSTTSLPGAMEQSVFWATRLFLGDYYKTYGAGTDSVETSVCRNLSLLSISWLNRSPADKETPERSQTVPQSSKHESVSLDCYHGPLPPIKIR